ncbi:MAG: AmiS/UreI family transporter [Dehalococcoidia bacterium]|nr:AmiS/UreI family transporter [Dehalococcoidia bacterium]
MSLPTVMNAIPMVAVWVYGVVFLVNGFFGLGKIEPKGTGVVSLACGTINVIFAFILIFLGILTFWLGQIPETAAVVAIVTGLLIFHFGIPCFTFSTSLIWGLDLKAAAVAAIFIGPFTLVYVPVFVSLGMLWFAANCVLWSWAIFSLVLMAYGKASPKVVGWTFIIESVVTCFVPGTILLLGYTLP